MHDDGLLCEIWEYNIENNEWSKLDVKMPFKLSMSAATAVLDGQYVIVSGGKDSNYKSSDDIWIYSVQNKSFRKSPIKCPDAFTGNSQAFTINDKQKDELAVFGHIREERSKLLMYGDIFLPRPLIEIVLRYYTNEWVHLWHSRNKQHCRINVFDIMNILFSLHKFVLS